MFTLNGEGSSASGLWVREILSSCSLDKLRHIYPSYHEMIQPQGFDVTAFVVVCLPFTHARVSQTTKLSVCKNP